MIKVIPKYWIGVVTKDHVALGVKGGFAQLGHGRRPKLAKMKRGDFLIYYSPYVSLADKAPCRCFTAIGEIISDEPYEAVDGEFKPFRSDVRYLHCKETPIQPLLPQLSFIKDIKHWGMPFRAGHFEINRSDFEIISHALV